MKGPEEGQEVPNLVTGVADSQVPGSLARECWSGLPRYLGATAAFEQAKVEEVPRLGERSREGGQHGVGMGIRGRCEDTGPEGHSRVQRWPAVRVWRGQGPGGARPTVTLKPPAPLARPDPFRRPPARRPGGAGGRGWPPPPAEGGAGCGGRGARSGRGMERARRARERSPAAPEP